ncbi:MAG: hypothetical protein KUL88_24010 [Rhizobium sp.]|nr:hypothetical protein [Rhizobium sp.]
MDNLVGHRRRYLRKAYQIGFVAGCLALGVVAAVPHHHLMRLLRSPTSAPARLDAQSTQSAYLGARLANISSAQLKSNVLLDDIPSFTVAGLPTVRLAVRATEVQTRHHVEIYLDDIELARMHRISLLACPIGIRHLTIEALDRVSGSKDGRYGRIRLDLFTGDVSADGDVARFGLVKLPHMDEGCAAGWRVVAFDMNFKRTFISLAVTLLDENGNLKYRGTEGAEVILSGIFLRAL